MTAMLSCLRFVKSEENDSLVQEAVQAVRAESGVEPIWVAREETEVDKRYIYVLESFDSPKYKALVGKCRLIGPAVILAHLKHEWPFPASTKPVFSMAMHGVVACFTQTGNKEKRDKLTQLVKWMGGKVEGDFTRRVTHLIAGHVGSTKYHVARKLQLPILLPSWVESCWNEKQVVYATHSTTLTPHLAPPFTGCTITVTGLDEKTRLKVKDACLKNGGKYSGELTKDVCTHLLVGNKSSTKFKYARQWKMYCVTPQWFYDSVEAGSCMPEIEYDADGDPGDSVGGVKGAGKVDDKPNEWRKNLENFHLPTVSDDEFLDGCKIYLSGFLEKELMVLYKIINLGGGVRYSRVSEDVSHVVLGEKEQSIVTEIQQLNNRPHVVSAQWLMDCCSKGEKVAENGYVCLEDESERSEVNGKGGPTQGRKRKLPGDDKHVEHSKRPRIGYDVNDEEHIDEEDLMNQYKTTDLPASDGAPPPVTGDGVLRGSGVSVSRLFSVKDRRIATQVVMAHGGKLVTPQEGSYLLLPLEVCGELVEETPAAHVTIIWLQRCIEAKTLLDPTSYYLFAPMTTPISESTLTDCVLALSQFSDIEREHLVRFSRGLGAVVQDHFARYPAHGLLATTHLILKFPSGDKYEFAHKWGVPALADSWLFACAKAQKIVPVNPHLMSPSKVTHPAAVKTLPSPSSSTTAIQSLPSPSSSTTAIQSLPPSSSSTTAVPTNTSSSKSKAQAEIGSRLSEQTVSNPKSGEDKGKMVANVGVSNTHTNGIGMGPAVGWESEQNGRDGEETERVLSGVVIAISKKLNSDAHLRSLAVSLGAEIRRRIDQKCTHYIYQGKSSEAVRDRDVKLAKEHDCFVVSPHWIMACSEGGVRADESSYPHTYNPNMTLTGISMPKQPLSQSQQPRVPSVPIPPHTDLPNPIPGTEPGPTQATSSDCGTDLEKIETEIENETKIDSSEAAKRLQEHLEQIKEAPNEQQKRRRSRRLINKEDKPSNPPPTSHSSHPHRSPDKKGRSRRDRRGRWKDEQILDSQVSDSQLLQVTYDDPKGRKEKEKLLARIERKEELKAQGVDPKSLRDTDHQSKTSLLHRYLTSGMEQTTEPPVGDNIRDKGDKQGKKDSGVSWQQDNEHVNGRDLPSSTPAAPSLNVPIVTRTGRGAEVHQLFDERTATNRPRKPPPPKFILSSLDQREKVDYGALVQQLGGEYIDQDYFTTKCTHLIVGKASRTEKYLGACAAGKWVLHKSYLEECRASNTFVKEEPHEWGVASSGGEVQPLEAAPRKWRLALAEKRKTHTHSDKHGGAFEGWKVLLFAERNKLPGLKRLLEAGGAHVLNKITIPGLKDVTHAFINISYFPKESLSLEQLVHNNIHCLKPDYIAEYLSKGSAVQLESLYINEVKPLLESSR